LSKKEAREVFKAWTVNVERELPLDSFNNKFQKFVDRED